MSDKPKHLCRTCEYSKKFEAEGKQNIYVSFGCNLVDNDMHNVIVKQPISDHVVECAKYKRASPLLRIRRKFFWWL